MAVELGIIQLQVLNKILSTKDASIITLNNLTSEYFSDYKDEFNFIKRHIDNYGTVPDTATFVGNFKNFELFEVKESDAYLIEELMRDKNIRYIAKNFNEIRELLNSNKVEDAVRL